MGHEEHVSCSLSLSVLMAIFLLVLGQPVPECLLWILLELRMMEVMVITGAIRCSSQHVTTNKPTPGIFYRLYTFPVAQQMVVKY